MSFVTFKMEVTINILFPSAFLLLLSFCVRQISNYMYILIATVVIQNVILHVTLTCQCYLSLTFLSHLLDKKQWNFQFLNDYKSVVSGFMMDTSYFKTAYK